MARNPNMESLNTWQPRELVEQIGESLRPGENKTDFVRAAVVRELKKRGIKAERPDVTQGRPPKPKEIDQ